MARARTGGAAFAWSLVFVGTGFFIFMILFVVTYTQNSELKQQAEDATAELNKFANRSQRDSSSVQQILTNKQARDTVVSILQADIDKLKAMISPDTNLSVDGINGLKASTPNPLSTDGQPGIPGPLLTHAQAMDQALSDANKETETARKAQVDAEGRAKTAEAARATLAKKFDDGLANISAGFDTRAGKLETSAAGYQAMSDALRAEMAETRKTLQDAINDRDARIEELVADNNFKDIRIRQLEAEKAGTIGVPDLIPADGAIISVAPDQDKVYINRGSSNLIQLGMTFEVFAEDELIKLNNYDELRGKATIEIISMDENTAVARIVRKARGASITPNDQVADLIYDANATYKFHVYGDFDIDNTGATSTRDRDRIKSMISRWGGEVSDELNWDVDFLVLGKEPPLPDPLGDDVIDPTVIRAHAEATKNYETYQSLAKTARELSVPVLNQNRFLALTGYYRR